MTHHPSITVFDSNRCEKRGGGIYALSQGPDFQGVVHFRNNSAVDGGGMYLQDGEMTVSAYSTLSGASGATSFHGPPPSPDEARRPTGNRAGNYGGALYLSGAAIRFTGNCTVTENYARSDGGGGFMYSSTATVTAGGEAEFLRNSAEESGGGVLLMSGSAWITEGRTEFAGPAPLPASTAPARTHARTHARTAVEWRMMERELSRVHAGNTANFLGGGIYLEDSVFSASPSSSTLIEGNNSTKFGGGIACRSIRAEFPSCAIDLAGSAIVRGNVAGDAGGGMILDGLLEDYPARLYVASGGTLTVEGNWAQYGGGLLADYLVAMDLVGTALFSNNHADSMGGALYLFYSAIHLEGRCEISGPASLPGSKIHTSGHIRIPTSTQTHLE